MKLMFLDMRYVRTYQSYVRIYIYTYVPNNTRATVDIQTYYLLFISFSVRLILKIKRKARGTGYRYVRCNDMVYVS